MPYYKTENEYQNPIVIVNVLEDYAGGVTISKAEFDTLTDELRAGAVINIDTDGKGHLCKTAKLYADATDAATTYQVEKNHEFLVGDIISTKDVDSCLAYTITVIDKTNADYDVITVGTTLGVAMTAANGVHLVQVAAEDAVGGASALLYEPTGINLNTQELVNEENPSVAVMVRGTINESNAPYYIPAVFKTALTSRIYYV